jgi:hypothetical protein
MRKHPNFEGLIQKRRRLLAQLATWPPVLRGTLCEHLNRCGNPRCRCRDKQNPVLHGPYQYLSHRSQNRTHTILLTQSKLPYARAWVANYKRLIKTVYELCEVNFRLLRYHHDKLEPTK